MAFYKKFQSKLNDLWYPRAITTGIPITTDRIADKLSLQSTVTRGDTYAVLKNLGGALICPEVTSSGVATPFLLVATV